MRRLVIIATLGAAFSAAASNPGADAGPASILAQEYDRAPARLGPLLSNAGDPSVDTIRKHLEAHDTDAALWEANRVTEAERWGRDRDVAWLVRGMIHRERSEHNLASAAFTKVRGGNGPLAEYGTFFEAEQDLARGRFWVAARECEKYLETYRRGRFEDACGRIRAVAFAKAGAWKNARDAAEAYDRDNTDAPITEQIELQLTLGALDEHPERMIGRLQEHALEFKAPLTGTIAVQKLRELREQGFEQAVVPSDLESLKARAYSLRSTKQTADAWAIYEQLAMETEDDPVLEKWAHKEATTFGWRTRNWDFLAKYYAYLIEQDDTPEDAWSLYRVLTRGGRYAEATDVAEAGLKRHANSRHWRRRHEEIGKSYLLEGDYDNARRHFLEMAKRGGWTGLRARYYAAFSAYMLGDDDDAMKRLTALVEADGAYAEGARYWRARLYDRQGETESAEADRKALVALDDDNWYAVLAAATLQRETARDRRAGRWTGPPLVEAPVFEGTPAPTFFKHVPTARATTPSKRPSSSGFAALLWGASSEPVVRAPTQPLLLLDPRLPPNMSVPASILDRRKADREIDRWANRHKAAFGDLQAAFDLARAGLYDFSGPLFSQVYEEWRAAYRNPGHSKHAAARYMKLQPDEWRQVFDFVGDHHHAARFNHSVWKTVEDPSLRLEAKRAAYPLAHARYVWSHSRANDIDPYLVLGLMRQESTYNSVARSPVGARGAMQIMPRTGHLLANIKGDADFTAADLNDPIFAVGYGIDYLGMLMERFDGVYPLAIASYNGGPFNVSSWLAGTGTSMPMDELVEHIPFRETRDYVQKVSAGYASYLALYAPEGTILDPHLQVRADDATVVDF